MKHENIICWYRISPNVLPVAVTEIL